MYFTVSGQAPSTIFHLSCIRLQVIKLIKQRVYTVLPDILYPDGQIMTFLALILIAGAEHVCNSI